jgi:hypothetical protein
MSVRRLLEEVDSKELSEWMVKDQIYPPVDFHFLCGLIVSALVNLLGSGRKKYKPSDFMPRRKRAVDTSVDQDARDKSLLTRLFSAMRKRKE